MKLEMTEKDRKLLIGLATGVIIVCIGYWGILPILSDIQGLEDDIAVQSAQEQVNSMKMMKLPMLEMENEEYEAEILAVRSEFYEMLTSDQIDKLFTGKAISHGLYAYDMNITMPTETTVLEPYKYSKRALEGEEEEELGLGLEPLEESQNPESSLLFEEEEEVTTGIYTAVVTMRLGGSAEALEAFLADLEQEGIKLRLCSFSYIDNRNIVQGDGNSYNVVVDRNLNVKLEIYMCEE